MIEPDTELSIRRQCELLGVSRSSLYYEPAPTSAEELALMRRIDELHLEYPFYGSRKIARMLRQQGRAMNRKCVQRLMRVDGARGDGAQAATRAGRRRSTRRIPYLLRRPEDRPAQPGVGQRHHVHPARRVASPTWWRSSTGHSRAGPGVAAVEHTRHVLLRRRAARGAVRATASPRSSTPTRARSSPPTRSPRVLRERGIKHQHGRQGPLPRQHLRRAAVAVAQVRGGLPACVRLPARRARAASAATSSSTTAERPHQALGYQTPDAYYRGLARAA